MTETADKTNFFDQIQWPINSALRDEIQWERSVELVKTLCGIADSVEWLEGEAGKDTYTHMPRKYSIGEAVVQFLPHWGFISIDGISFDKSIQADQILEAVQHVSRLKQMGARITDPLASNR